MVQISLKDFPRSLIDNGTALVHVMAWCRTGNRPLLEQCWSKSLTHICGTRGRWVNTLWPNDTIWRHKSGSTLAQVMACCLTAPSHYLNQCWLIISKVQWHSSESILQDIPQPSVTEISLKMAYLKLCSNLPVDKELIHWIYSNPCTTTRLCGPVLLPRCYN